ncbi:hypothetical protein GCM10028803_04570 [Larkinella knui]|uniref:Uncharacterized protein n=1 Tax=Larkinella knui TaxID=2025310 RepID=A0A3P1CLS4_9BACT|nr:hypothetical protein [Larkinella knui]RRB13864.1 hypothetical protein EHT87_16535 [Larkinella knui]
MPDYVALKTGHRFSGSNYRNHYDNLLKKKADINANPEFFLALAKTLGYLDFNAYKIAHESERHAVHHENEKADDDAKRTIQSLTATNQRLRIHVRWMKVIIIGTGGMLVILSWLLFTKQSSALPKGHIVRKRAHRSTLAKGIIGNWYSYNRTNEARGKKDPYIFNRIAWTIGSDQDGYLTFERYWKAMEFAGWIEFIGGATPQLHFFMGVYQNGNGRREAIGYRHFNCGLWGENHDWLQTDTLICVCTTYDFRGSSLGVPLASRELLIRQPGISFDSLKKGATTLTIQQMSWLDKILPKQNSYIFQKPGEIE